ncbi:MAG: glycosyltransferase family 4 protein [Thermosipho sp. (in: Bacteria)]|nr:glycosyltransferase family 4 protein [Thermosipho sp. (in: thermotogales)]
MNILILNWRDISHPQAGGAEKYVHEIGKRLVKKGHNVTLFCGSYPNANPYDKIDGIKIMRKGGKYTLYIWALVYLVKNKDKFDVIIDSENGIPFFSPLLFDKKRVICIMHHVHIEVFDRELPFPLNKIGKLLEGKVMPMLYRESLFVPVSPSTKKEMFEKLFIRGNYFPIVYNGVPFEKLNIGHKKTRAPNLIYFGRVKRYKRIDHIIWVYKRIKQRIKNVRLVIAGKMDRGYFKEILKLNRELNLKVSFFDNVSEEKKVELLSQSWVYVITSMKEGWGISVIEANACGVPVVGYDVPGLRDSIRNEYSGLLVGNGDVDSLANEVMKLIENPKIRIKFSHNTKLWAERFSWEKSAERFERVLKSVVGE